MTSKDELAKQKVLAAHKDARERPNGSIYTFHQRSMNGKTWSGIKDLGTSWQNAAESLPARAMGDEDDGKCGASDAPGHYCLEDKGHLCRHQTVTPHGYHYWDVAPVGANEKELSNDFLAWWIKDGAYYDPDTEDVPWFDKRRELAAYTWEACKAAAAGGNKALCPCTASGLCAGVSASLACRSDLKIPFAEPKPTPSTPSVDEDDLWDSHSELIETISCGMVGDEPLMRRSEFSKALKKLTEPQPDSSSIPELDRLAHTLAYESSCAAIEGECIGADEDWQSLEQANMDALKDDIRYLDMRGLLEHHPQYPHWIRFHDESEATA